MDGVDAWTRPHEKRPQHDSRQKGSGIKPLVDDDLNNSRIESERWGRCGPSTRPTFVHNPTTHPPHRQQPAHPKPDAHQGAHQMTSEPKNRPTAPLEPPTDRPDTSDHLLRRDTMSETEQFARPNQSTHPTNTVTAKVACVLVDDDGFEITVEDQYGPNSYDRRSWRFIVADASHYPVGSTIELEVPA